MNLTDQTPTKNFPLLWKVYDHIVAHPEEHNQSLFAYRGECGTTFCFAGHTALIARPDLHYSFRDGACVGHLVDDSGMFARSSSRVAQEALGLSNDEADDLFYGAETADQIRDLIAGWEVS